MDTKTCLIVLTPVFKGVDVKAAAAATRVAKIAIFIVTVSNERDSG